MSTSVITTPIQAELVRQLLFLTGCLVGTEPDQLFFSAFGDANPAGFVTAEQAELMSAPYGDDVLAELDKPFINEGLATIAYNVLGDRNLFWSKHHCLHMSKWGIIVPMYQPKVFGRSELSAQESHEGFLQDDPTDLLTAIKQRLVGKGVIAPAETHGFYGLTMRQAIPKLAPLMELNTGFIWK